MKLAPIDNYWAALCAIAVLASRSSSYSCRTGWGAISSMISIHHFCQSWTAAKHQQEHYGYIECSKYLTHIYWHLPTFADVPIFPKWIITPWFYDVTSRVLKLKCLYVQVEFETTAMLNTFLTPLWLVRLYSGAAVVAHLQAVLADGGRGLKAAEHSSATAHRQITSEEAWYTANVWGWFLTR